VTEYDETVYY